MAIVVLAVVISLSDSLKEEGSVPLTEQSGAVCFTHTRSSPAATAAPGCNCAEGGRGSPEPGHWADGEHLTQRLEAAAAQ